MSGHDDAREVMLVQTEARMPLIEETAVVAEPKPSKPPMNSMNSMRSMNSASPIASTSSPRIIQNKSEPVGHRNLAVRGGVSATHGFLTLILIAYDVDSPHASFTAVFQFCGAATLFNQWRTANPTMFVLRGLCSWGRCLVTIHAASCGRRWMWDECDTAGWSDIRAPFRFLHCFAALRFLLNGLSLMLQYKYPKAGVGIRGNQQLFYRGIVQMTGVPLHFTRAFLKLGTLFGTEYARLPVEIGINFIRCFVLIPVAGWSLFNQWVMTGAGRQTDDIRTSRMGSVQSRLDSMADYIEPHLGHRDCLVRAMATFFMGCLTGMLIYFHTNMTHDIPIMVCQFGASITLFVQYRHDDTKMLLFRAITCWLHAAVLTHHAVCGRVKISTFEHCRVEAWHDMQLRPFRSMDLLAVGRMFLIGVSLMLEYCYPGRGTTNRHGDEQLFYRAWLRGAGIGLWAVRAVQKFTLLIENGTLDPASRSPPNIAVDFIRGFVVVPIQTYALFHQWRFTGSDLSSRGRVRDELGRSMSPDTLISSRDITQMTVTNT